MELRRCRFCQRVREVLPRHGLPTKKMDLHVAFRQRDSGGRGWSSMFVWILVCARVGAGSCRQRYTWITVATACIFGFAAPKNSSSCILGETFTYWGPCVLCAFGWGSMGPILSDLDSTVLVCRKRGWL